MSVSNVLAGVGDQECDDARRQIFISICPLGYTGKIIKILVTSPGEGLLDLRIPGKVCFTQ